MKNSRSIFKNYSKKILKSEAFVSVIIVCVLALGIIGTSYALYMDVDKDTDYELVQVGDLSIGFENGSNTISLTNMTPSDDDIALKSSDNIYSFYVYNTGTYNAKFDIKLVTADGNEVDSNYIKYRLCKDNSENCKDVSTLSDNSVIHSEQLQAKQTGDTSNPSAYYFLRIWISNTYSETTSKNIKLKVVIESSNTSNNEYTTTSSLFTTTTTTKTTANVFTFTIDGETYSAEEGMTWEEWVESDYSPESYYYSDDTVFTGEVVKELKEYIDLEDTTGPIEDYEYYSLI